MAKRLGIFILLWLGLLQVIPVLAQEGNFTGLVLLNVVDVGAGDNSNRLFLAEASTSKVIELTLEGGGVFAPWWGWSPDGSQFAYLAPARRGENYELWLADADILNPVPRPPLFNLDLTVQVADWNPFFNIIAVGTESAGSTRDGLYLVNTEYENVVFLAEVDLPRNGILDWAHGGYWLAYSLENAALNMINTETLADFPLRSFTQPRPALLPHTETGWTNDDRYYVFSDDIYQTLYAITTDGLNNYAVLHPDFTLDPFSIQPVPNSNQLIALYDRSLYFQNLTSGELRTLILEGENDLEPDYFVAQDGTVILNSFIVLPEADYAECLWVNPNTGEVQFIRQILNNATWTHTRCQLLAGGTHVAVMATDDFASFGALGDELRYDLWIVSTDMTQQRFLTNQYAGFEQANLGFSAARQQVILPIDQSLMLYDLQGNFKVLADFADLNLQGDVTTFEFAWQP